MNLSQKYHHFLATLMVISFMACNNDKKDQPETKSPTDTFIYGFVDASVPPQYHRSYKIKVTSGMVYLTVESYGDILLSDSSVINESSYKKFVSDITKLNIRNKKEKVDEGCTGGTSDHLDLYSDSPQQLKGYTFHCGGEDYGDLEGDVEAAVQLFRSLVPEFSKKIDGTRKDD